MFYLLKLYVVLKDDKVFMTLQESEIIYLPTPQPTR